MDAIHMMTEVIVKCREYNTEYNFRQAFDNINRETILPLFQIYVTKTFKLILMTMMSSQ